jgi:hypothetical protein
VVICTEMEALKLDLYTARPEWDYLVDLKTQAFVCGHKIETFPPHKFSIYQVIF